MALSKPDVRTTSQRRPSRRTLAEWKNEHHHWWLFLDFRWFLWDPKREQQFPQSSQAAIPMIFFFKHVWFTLDEGHQHQGETKKIGYIYSTPWLFNIAMETGPLKPPFMVGIFHGYVSHNQMEGRCFFPQGSWSSSVLISPERDRIQTFMPLDDFQPARVKTCSTAAWGALKYRVCLRWEKTLPYMKIILKKKT